MPLRTRLTQPLDNTLKRVVFIADRRYNVYQTLFKINVILPLHLQLEPMSASVCLCRVGDTALGPMCGFTGFNGIMLLAHI